jgi:hypothetical protein
MTGPKTSFWMISSSCLTPGDDGRGVEEALLADPVAARLDLGVGGQALDESGDLLELVGVVERPVQHILVVRLPGLRLGSGLRERGDELVVDGLLYEDTRGRRTVLARR